MNRLRSTYRGLPFGIQVAILTIIAMIEGLLVCVAKSYSLVGDTFVGWSIGLIMLTVWIIDALLKWPGDKLE